MLRGIVMAMLGCIRSSSLHRLARHNLVATETSDQPKLAHFTVLWVKEMLQVTPQTLNLKTSLTTIGQTDL